MYNSSKDSKTSKVKCITVPRKVKQSEYQLQDNFSITASIKIQIYWSLKLNQIFLPMSLHKINKTINCIYFYLISDHKKTLCLIIKLANVAVINDQLVTVCNHVAQFYWMENIDVNDSGCILFLRLKLIQKTFQNYKISCLAFLKILFGFAM